MNDTAQAIQADDLQQRVFQLEQQVNDLKQKQISEEKLNKVAIICFSGEWDRLFAAFTIANGALALGQEVDMFFTFWGASALRTGDNNAKGEKTWIQRLLGKLLPTNIDNAPLSRLNFGGLGKPMLRRLLKQKKIDDLDVLMKEALDLGAAFHCCDTSLSLFGWGNADLIQGDASQWCGVASFLNGAFKSKLVLFI
ncbi:MAG: DsrE/DsrF/DrsH-like family protein [Myxococcota bacterium]|nr:DsrE/DsrF/DrsH-like family protein [Myxococcota bacterium]